MHLSPRQLRRSLVLGLCLALPACVPAEDCEGDDCTCAEFSKDGVCCDGFLELSAEGECVARAWPPTQLHTFGEAGAYAIEAAVDGEGHALVSWQRRHPDPALARSMLAEQTDAGWTQHALGDPALGFGARAPLAARGREAWVAWTQFRTSNDGTDRSAVFLRRRNADGAWTSSVAGESLSFPPRAYEPRPLLPSTGEGLVVWNQWQEDGGYGVALGRQAPGEDTLFPPNAASDVLSPPVFFSNAPQIAVGPNGDAIITWYQALGDGLRLFVSERDRTGGTFSRPSEGDWISPAGPPLASHEVRSPVVAIGRFGEALVFWSQEHPSGATGLYAASRDSFGEWITPANIDQTFGPLRYDAACIEVAISTTAEAHVAWFDGRPGETVVYGAHRSNDGAWDEPATAVLSSEGAVAQDPRLAVGPDGEAAVVWTENAGDRWRVMARRRGPRSADWGAPTQLSNESEGDALGPTVAIGSGGPLVAAWAQGPIGAQTVRVAVLP